MSENRVEQLFAQICACSHWPAGREHRLLLDADVDTRELGYADYATRTVHLSPSVLTRSEDHVASLLAHELGHLAHGPIQMSPSRRRTSVALLLGGVLCVLAGALGNALTTSETGWRWWTLPLVFGGAMLALCAPAMSLAQSRQAELRADLHAAALLSSTAWDATAFLRDAVEQDEKRLPLRHLSPVRLVIRLLDTHPSHRQRLRRMNSRAAR